VKVVETKSNSKVHKILSSLNENKWRVALKGILSGLIAGLLVVLYRMGIEYGTDTALNIYVFFEIPSNYDIAVDAAYCCCRTFYCMAY